MALATYPLNDVDYSAEDAELFHCTRSSGIYANDDFDYSVTGADNTITVGVGLAWIRNSRFSGKVAALKAALSLDLGVPDAVYPRIDAVVIQFDANANRTEIVVKQGTAASSPAAPAISRTEVLHELHLYHVRREAGAAAISVSSVTDLRLDPNYCGLMADSVTEVDTSAIAAQARALIEELRTELQAVKDSSAYMLKGETADAAKKLITARTVQVNLGSETAADFDGTEDIKPGVTGVLPIKHGGHGATDGSTGLKNLLAAGPMVLSPNQYGTALPSNPVDGQFFVLIKE